MTVTVAIIDYGLGNISAFARVYQRLNIEFTKASTADQICRAHRLILPGVGSFDWSMKLLNESGLRACLEDAVLARKVPVLGVCVGMQILANSSEEGKSKGLGWIDGDVYKLNVKSTDPPLPHMGWNQIKTNPQHPLFHGLDEPQFYFLHSYAFSPACPHNTIATFDYGSTCTASVQSDNIYGVQFHPEKSHHWGSSLLSNFARIV